MGLTALPGQFTLNTSTGDQTIDTGSGVVGKALLVWGTYQTAEGTGAASSGFHGCGVDAAGTIKNRVAAWAADDNVATSNDGCGNATGLIRLFSNGTPTLDVVATLSSFGTGANAGKFTINISNAGPACLVYYLYLGGTDLTDVDLLQYAAPTITGNRDDTGASFTPDFAYAFGCIGTSQSDKTELRAYSGCSLSASKRWAMWTGADDGVTMTGNNKHYHTDVAALVLSNQAGTPNLDAIADHVAFISGGRTLNWTDAAGVATFYYVLYLKGGVYDVGNFASPTGGGTPQDQVVTTASALSAVFFASTQQATAMATSDNEWGLMLGAGSATGSPVEAVATVKGQNVFNTDENMTNASTKCIRALDPGTLVEADYKSQDATSFTITWTTIDATQAVKVFWWGIGAAPVTAILEEEFWRVEPARLAPEPAVSLWG